MWNLCWSKNVKKPFKQITIRVSEPLEQIHSDFTDFKNIETRGGKRYYTTFVDN